jgi:TonB-dependent starch-binding outer membrane protein SusC
MRYYLQLKTSLTCLLIWLTGYTIIGQITVTGVVLDEIDDLPLIGANVLVKNSTQGTITDYDGRFSLELKDANATLVFTYLGYITREVPLAGRTELEVKLGQSSSQLDEVVVVGFGVQRKSDVTGAVASIKAEELRKIPSGDFTQALQGKVAGLEVIGSGVPGQADNYN